LISTREMEETEETEEGRPADSDIPNTRSNKMSSGYLVLEVRGILKIQNMMSVLNKTSIMHYVLSAFVHYEGVYL